MPEEYWIKFCIQLTIDSSHIIESFHWCGNSYFKQRLYVHVSESVKSCSLLGVIQLEMNQYQEICAHDVSNYIFIKAVLELDVMQYVFSGCLYSLAAW